MRTNIDLDDELVDQAFKATGVHTKKELINLALKELVRARNKRILSDLSGRIRLRDDFDHKRLREVKRGTR
jgi:Arc/MetJ family transcription regulator